MAAIIVRESTDEQGFQSGYHYEFCPEAEGPATYESETLDNIADVEAYVSAAYGEVEWISRADDRFDTDCSRDIVEYALVA